MHLRESRARQPDNCTSKKAAPFCEVDDIKAPIWE